MIRFWKAFSLAVIVLSLAGSMGCNPREEEAASEKAPTPVKVVDLKAVDLPVVVEEVGRLIPNREVALAAEVSGVVLAYHADVGDRVSAGQVLVELDPKDYSLALAEAEANQAAAKAQLEAAANAYKRARALLPREVISKDSYDKFVAEYKSAKAAVGRAEALVNISKERLNKTAIRAPFDGYITDSRVEVGQSVGMGQFMGQPIVGLADMSTMRVVVYLAEMEYVYLNKEDPVQVVVEAFPNQTFTGRIDQIGIKADERTNTFGVEILVDNPDLMLKAGLTARVRLTTQVISSTVLIPQSTILYREDRREVFVVDAEGRALAREVELGRAHGSQIQVISGLTPGDRLVVSGGQYLSSGDQVKVQTAEAVRKP